MRVLALGFSWEGWLQGKRLSSWRRSCREARSLQLHAMGFCRATSWGDSYSQLTKEDEPKEGLEQSWGSGQDREKNEGV